MMAMGEGRSVVMGEVTGEGGAAAGAASSPGPAGGPRTSRYLILSCGVLTLLMFGTIYAWSVFIPPLEAEFSWSRSQTSLVFSVAMIGLSIGMISIGFLSKRFSLRTCFVIATVLVAVGLFTCQFITQLWQLYVCYGVMCGIGTGMAYTTWTTNVMAWFGDRVGFASGVLVMGFGVGALVLGGLASALIYSPLGWRFAFAAIAVLVVIEAAATIWLIKDPPPEIAALRPKHDDTGVSLEGSKTVRTSSFWLFCMWRSFVMGSTAAVIAEASVMMTGIGASVAFATVAVGILGVGNGVGRPIGGILYDILGQNRTMVIYPIIAFVLDVIMAIAYLFASPLLFAACILAQGLLYGMFAAINTSYMRTTFGQKYLSMNTGLAACVLAPFNLVFPLIAALVFESFGNYEPFFIAMPVFAVVSLVCGVFLKPANVALAKKYGDGNTGGA